MKNDILARLYRSKIEPMGEVIAEAQQHRHELREAKIAERVLESTFDGQQQKMYDELNAAQAAVNTIMEDAAFSEGFKLAVQIITATYYEDDDSLMKKWSSFFMEEQE